MRHYRELVWRAAAIKRMEEKAATERTRKDCEKIYVLRKNFQNVPRRVCT